MRTRRTLLLLLAGAAVLLVLRTGFFIVDRGQAAVVTQFGKPVRVVDGPGLYLKAPLPVQGVETYDRRLLVWDSGPVECATADSASVVLTVYAAWRISDPGMFALAVRTREAAEARIGDVVASELSALVAREPMRAFVSTQQEDLRLPEVLRAAARSSRAALEGIGLTVADLGVTRIGLPDRAQDLVIERMVAEQDARTALELAAGQEQAARVHAAADSERRAILEVAREEAARIRSEAEAEAMRIYADAGEADPEFFRFVRTLESYDVIMDGRTTVVLSSGSKLLELLDEKD